MPPGDEESVPFLDPGSPRAISTPPPLVAPPTASPPSATEPAPWPSAGVTRRLYGSHLLSTANSRVFEFGSVLYLAAVFPGTLLPMSVYAMARGAAAILLSSMVGQYIDSGDRLKVVRLSIVLQRVVVAVSCVMFYALSYGLVASNAAKIGFLIALTFLACIEKLCSIMNLVSVEKDWVVVVAQENPNALRVMNSQMRRIDLCCKLFGPFFIALVDSFSTNLAILVNLGMNVASVVVEYYAIAQVYDKVPALQDPKTDTHSEGRHRRDTDHNPATLAWRSMKASATKMGGDMLLYFRHPAVIPSFACALLYLTVLSFSGQMVTYLLSTGYSSAHVAIARTLSVAFEVLATWAGPWLMERLGPVRAGLWFASWQMGCLFLGMSIFWAFADQPIISASGLVGGTILSRVGLWGFDLCTQIVVQEDVEPESRGAFSAAEASWQNVFELCSYTMTIILSSPDQFRWPASTSVVAVIAAWALYTRFVVARRGHLLHWPACLPPLEKPRPSPDVVLEAMRRRSRDSM